jgi:hypothetical protein
MKKKLFAALAAALLLGSTMAAPVYAAETYKKGDVNMDGEITVADAQMILDYEAKLLNRELSIPVADVSGDGVIDSNDAVLIQQYLAGKLDKFPAEKSE